MTYFSVLEISNGDQRKHVQHVKILLNNISCLQIELFQPTCINAAFTKAI